MEQFPQKFGRYELLERIATGGMAHIYRARLAAAEGTAKELVIKRVLPHLTQNRDFIDMFIDEARITMPLNHGNIVQVFEFGQEGTDYFLAMEYVRGRNLETVLTRLEEQGERMPLSIALYIGSEIAKGLDFAHRNNDAEGRPLNIIHRDVSPQNVLLGFAGVVKLTDFGIAKARTRIRQTAAGIIQGKACYLSPEQAECRDLDHRSDQFSFGILLYEMLTGVRCFEGQSEVETLDRVRAARYIRPIELRIEIPPEIERVLTKALSRNVDKRYTSLAELQVVLSRTLHDLAPEFTPRSLGEWISELFAAEISYDRPAPVTGQRMADRLVEAGMEVESGMSAEEMLQLGTVALDKNGQAAEPISQVEAAEAQAERAERAESRSSAARRLGWLVLLAVLGAGLYFGLPELRDLTLGVKPLFDGGLESPGPAAADAGALAAPDAVAAVAPEIAAPEPDAAAAGNSGKAESARVAPRVQWGFLTMQASPWAYVEINGKRLKGETPIFKHRVRANRSYRIKFINPELKIVRTEKVYVKPGVTHPVSVVLAGQ